MDKDIYLQNILKADLPVTFYWVGKDGEVLCCNERQARAFGLSSADELIGKDVYYLGQVHGWSKELCDKVREHDSKVMNSGTTLVEEEKAFLQGVEHTYLSHKCPLKDQDENTIGVFGFSIDITDRKEAERLRAEKIASEKREETLRLLASSMAHELRTPLAAIDMGAAGILKNLPDLIEGYKVAKEHKLDIPYMPPNNIRLLEEMAENIRHEAREAFSIVDMLVFKSGLASINTDDFKLCSMSDCVAEALERYPYGKDEKAKVHWQDDDFTFWGDHALITHVLFNLLKNALHFIGVAAKGGAQIWVEQTDEYNQLHFKDTGLGIASDILPRIFEPFFTTSANGTGVGLAFSQLVMEKMGGTMECHSEEGQYTEFILSFPIQS